MAHANERSCAREHLRLLKKDDAVVYERGYFSYPMLPQHLAMETHAVFRLQESSDNVIRDFFARRQTDIITTIYPSSRTQRDIKLEHPELTIVPLQIRLIKYQIDDQTFCLGTTLLDQNRSNNIQDLLILTPPAGAWKNWTK